MMPRQNGIFAAYVTRVAFNLNLSKEQIYTLAHIDAEYRRSTRDDYHDSGSCFVMAVRGLRNRGLIDWEDPANMKPKWARYPYRLSEAGEHVLALLKIAGLVRQIPVETEKRKAA